MEVGTLTDPGDPSTFQIIQVVPLFISSNAIYGPQHSILLGNAVGNFIAFRHPGTSNAIFIDDVIIEVAPTTAEFVCNTTAINLGRVHYHEVGETPRTHVVAISNTL
jgi:hypothetical protein